MMVNNFSTEYYDGKQLQYEYYEATSVQQLQY